MRSVLTSAHPDIADLSAKISDISKYLIVEIFLLFSTAIILISCPNDLPVPINFLLVNDNALVCDNFDQ